MNITVCEFEDYGELPGWLERLRAEIEAPQARSTGWLFSMRSAPGIQCDLQVVRTDAPVKPGADEAIALVARRQDDRPLLEERYAVWERENPSLRFIGNHVVEYGGKQIYAVTARCRGDEDDGAVDDAVREFLDEIESRRERQHEAAKSVHLQLSSSGGTVPPVFAFMRVVRVFGRWKKDNVGSPLRLTLHIQSDVEFNLTSERIDVQELLSSELIRFWAVVSPGGNKEPVRRVLHYREDTPLSDVLEDLGVPFGEDLAEWVVSVCPSPRKSQARNTTWSLYSSNPQVKLLSIGVVFGSVLTLECGGDVICRGKAEAAH
jgi:hypothetical protein